MTMDFNGLTRVPQTSDEKVASPTVRRGKDHLDVDERRDGLLRDGILTNTTDRPAQPPKSLGELSLYLIAPLKPQR